MKQRVRVYVRGVVQGVGFRPFLLRQTARFALTGWARNTSKGVELLLEGDRAALSSFLKVLRESPPPLAVVEQVSVQDAGEGPGETAFTILESQAGAGFTLVAPDTAPCGHCLEELSDPQNRRYRYPFLNCTDCGPRYTILRALPYDRVQTAMLPFPMCKDCAREYFDESDRRCRFETNCCPACGPQVTFYSADRRAAATGDDAFRAAQTALARGEILAVKGVGGIHLACKAEDEAAVLRLRARKRRPAKPLAVLCRDITAARRFCRISQAEAALLESPRRPVVLLEKKVPEAFPALSGNTRLGLFLPYSPLHMLLLDGMFGGPDAVVLTSANRPGEPVLLDNADAFDALSGIADGFLLHNREIYNRCDDSVVFARNGGAPYFVRRSRGWVPQPLDLSQNAEGIFAFGAEEKASFALGKGTRAFLSPHIGDLKNAATLSHYRTAMETFERLFAARPRAAACDLHPDYLSTREAESRAKQARLPLYRIQHHWAHMAACMADNGLEGPAFGILWDGTGLGADGTVWGCEFFKGDFTHYTRVGSMRPIRLPGGEAAIREIGRIALSLLRDAGLPDTRAPVKDALRKPLCAMVEKNLSCVEASSAGRLFDGVYALLSGTPCAAYDGEAPVLLESMLRAEVAGRRYPVAFYEENGVRRFDPRPMIRKLSEDLADGVPAAAIAKGFHDAMCEMALSQCEALNPEKAPVVLSGGVFFNQYLLTKLPRMLKAAGFSVFCHHRVSTGDEGICLGQLAIAAKKEECSTCALPSR